MFYSMSPTNSGLLALGELSSAPEKDQQPEERLVQVLDKVVQGVLKAPPATAQGVPQAVMETLCLQHPRYKDWAEYRAKKAALRGLEHYVGPRNA